MTHSFDRTSTAGTSGIDEMVLQLVVCDILGREVVTLISGQQAAGSHEVRFDAGGLASGVCICRLTQGSFVQTRKMLLMR
jgi:hypothetical protein